MNNLKITLLTGIFLINIVNISTAQINGNGQMKTLQLDASTVTQLYANFPIQLILDNRQTTSLTITTDENVLAALKINNTGTKVSILQDTWVEPTKMVQVKGALPTLNQLKMEGYGHAVIKNLAAQTFDLDISVGTAEIAGSAKQMTIKTSNGKINALHLNNESAQVAIKGYGTVQISPTQSLGVMLSEDATVVYQNKPQKITQNGKGRLLTVSDFQEEVLPEVEYIKIKLKNNKSAKIDTYVKGPRQERFSYGIPFKGKQSRTESWPVGTKLYLVNNIGIRKLLYTVSKQDANQTVNLFGS